MNCEVRSLNLGDVLWIARRYRRTVDGRQEVEEYVLDMIVERKTIDDLNLSIVDKRFIEQKDRLEQCGLRKIVYLVEGTNVGQNAIRTKSVITAIARTQVYVTFSALTILFSCSNQGLSQFSCPVL